MSRFAYNMVASAVAVGALFAGALLGRYALDEKEETSEARLSKNSFVMGEANAPVPYTLLDPRFGVICYVLGSNMSCVALSMPAERPNGDL
jgi:hypothetical protein